jgi:hypothetical protein
LEGLEGVHCPCPRLARFLGVVARRDAKPRQAGTPEKGEFWASLEVSGHVRDGRCDCVWLRSFDTGLTRPTKPRRWAPARAHRGIAVRIPAKTAVAGAILPVFAKLVSLPSDPYSCTSTGRDAPTRSRLLPFEWGKSLMYALRNRGHNWGRPRLGLREGGSALMDGTEIDTWSRFTR